MGRQLTEKQRRFVEAYMGQARGNATQAARLAGYKGSDVTLCTVGSENLRKPQIQEALQDRISADEDGLVADRQERLQFLTRVLRGEETNQLLQEGEPVEVRVGAADRLRAADLLNKVEGLYQQKLEIQILQRGLRMILDIVAAEVGPREMERIREQVGKLAFA